MLAASLQNYHGKMSSLFLLTKLDDNKIETIRARIQHIRIYGLISSGLKDVAIYAVLTTALSDPVSFQIGLHRYLQTRQPQLNLVPFRPVKDYIHLFHSLGDNQITDLKVECGGLQFDTWLLVQFA